jgi:DNA-binding NarL/FixJ family response regulator
MTVNVVLVDDHKVIREGLRAIFALDPDIRVTGEASDGAEALPLCRQLQPDLVMMDIGLPGISGIEATAEILRVCPRTKIVIFSIYDDEDTVVAAIRAGARGFILKRSAVQEVLSAVRTVAAGGTYLTPHASNQLLARLHRGGAGSEPNQDIELLSPRELQVMRLVAEGKSSKEVARLLKLEHNTVRSYRKTMMTKLGVNNLSGLIQIAPASGLVSAPEKRGPLR